MCSLRKIVVLVLVSTILVGCNQEEFYEKEYLEGLGVIKEDVPAPDDIVSIPNANEGNNNQDPNQDPNEEGNNNNNQDPNQDPNQEGNNVAQHTESFIQNNVDNKIDILWVIDNSGSMSDEQEALARNFELFINQFIDNDINFQMAITTTDARANYNGNMIGDPAKLNRAYAESNRGDFLDYFYDTIQVGIRGSGQERGLQTAKSFFSKNNVFSEESHLAIVFLSDEEDQSAESVQAYVDYFKSLKQNTGNVKLHSIVNFNANARNYETNGTRYVAATNATAGVQADIKEDFHQTLSVLGESISDLKDSFVLSKNATGNNITVTVNDVEVNTWDFDQNNNAIKFHSDEAPADNSTIVISYDFEAN